MHGELDQTRSTRLADIEGTRAGAASMQAHAGCEMKALKT
jgi:hypothetical protein